MSILDNRPALAHEIGQIAEAAGYLWQKGWAERNGGNITVNITEHADEAMRAMPAARWACRRSFSSRPRPTA